MERKNPDLVVVWRSRPFYEAPAEKNKRVWFALHSVLVRVEFM